MSNPLEEAKLTDDEMFGLVIKQMVKAKADADTDLTSADIKSVMLAVEKTAQAKLAWALRDYMRSSALRRRAMGTAGDYLQKLLENIGWKRPATTE